MKKLAIISLMILVVGAFIFQFSGSVNAKPLKLKWTTFEPDVPGSSQQAVRRFAELVEEKTEGRVTIKVYWGGVLGKAPDFLKMIGGKGVADGGFIIHTYHQWEIPLVAASGLPFLTTGYRTGPAATTKLYKEWPALQEEMKKVNVKPLWFFQPHPHWICVKEPFKKWTDLKGKKMWVAGFYQKMTNSFGVINVTMSAPEAYDAMQKGVIEGVFGNPYHTFKIFKYTEIGKYLVEWPFGGQPVNMQGINLDVWNKISPKDQKAIEEIAAGMNDWFVDVQDKESIKLKEYFEKTMGCEHIRLSDEEYAWIEPIGKDIIWSSWLETAKKNGVPGEEWFKRYRAILDSM